MGVSSGNRAGLGGGGNGDGGEVVPVEVVSEDSGW